MALTYPTELASKVSTDRTDTTKQSTPKPDPLNITIGVELEFVLAVSTWPLQADQEDSFDGPMEAQQLVRDVLRQPMTVACETCGEQHSFKLPVQPITMSDHDYWCVEEDNSLDVDEEELEVLGEDRRYFQFYSIEVKSRVLHLSSSTQTSESDPVTGHKHSISKAQEIDAVLERLHEAFTGPVDSNERRKNGTHLIVTKKSGLHVHVGNRKRGFPLHTVKKILNTYIANERAIDGLHAANRIGGTKMAFSSLKTSFFERHGDDVVIQPRAYNSPWSSQMIIVAHTMKMSRHGYSKWRSAIPKPSNDPPSCYPETYLYDWNIGNSIDSFHVGDWLDVIDYAPSLNALQQMQWKTGRGTLNLKNLAEYQSGGMMPDTNLPWDGEDDTNGPYKMTVEFRQHLDPAKIYAWIDVAILVVRDSYGRPMVLWNCLGQLVPVNQQGNSTSQDWSASTRPVESILAPWQSQG